MIDTAIMVCPREGHAEEALLGLDVGGLRLLVRSLLTARQAGIDRLVVVASPAQRQALQPQIAAEPRLDGCVAWADAAGDIELIPARSVLMIPSTVLRAEALRAWRTRAEGVDGAVAPAGFDAGPWAVPPALLAPCVDGAREGRAGLERFGRQLRAQGRLTVVPWEGSGLDVVRSAADVPAVERRMLRAQRSAEDGPIVDRYVNRTLSEPITRLVVRWPVTPNQVTVVSLLTGLLGAWLLACDGAAAALCGLLLFQLSVVLDHVDGEIARLKFQFSRLGKWLDNFSDHAVDLAVIGCVAWRVAVAGAAGSVAALGAAAAVGVTGSFLVVFWWSLRGRRDALSEKARRGAATLTSMANRDGFCLALWATLLAGRPAWFLWTLAIGSNVYWLAWLAICGVPALARRAK